MKIALLTLLFTVSITASAWARLGEDGQTIVQRYGQPLSEFDQKGEGGKVPLIKLTFQKSGFQIEVSLAGGISVAESYKKINGEIITIDEARLLLTANAQGHGWEAPAAIGSGVQRWMRDDGAMAKLTNGHDFYVTTKELIDAETTAQKLTVAPSLEGF